MYKNILYKHTVNPIRGDTDMKEKTVKAYKPSKVKLDKKASMAVYLLTLIAAVLTSSVERHSRTPLTSASNRVRSIIM